MSKWIFRPNNKSNAKIRLFCFPYAGSSALITYKFLIDALPYEIEVCPVEFPGRGTRISENLIDNLNEVISNISEEFTEFLDKPFIFFGHSMGALIAYELAHLLSDKYGRIPNKLYLSAHTAPNVNRKGQIIYLLEKKEFLEKLIQMKGISEEILLHQELLDMVLPIIKNDYKLCETYSYISKKKMDIPFHIFGGKYDEDISVENLRQWQNLTNGDFDLTLIDGDHFYLTKNKEEFLGILNSNLKIDLIKILNYE